MASRLLTLLMAFVFVGGLAMTPACVTSNIYHSDDPLGAEPEVTVSMMDARYSEEGFSVRVLFTESFSYYEGVVQEVEMDWDGDGDFDYVLVEYFKLKDGRMSGVHDHHSGSDAYRRMTVYPANVKDVDWMYDSFAQLPENMDGSKLTNIPDSFNFMYQIAHDTKGYISDAALDRAVVWEIEYDSEDLSLEVTLP